MMSTSPSRRAATRHSISGRGAGAGSLLGYTILRVAAALLLVMMEFLLVLPLSAGAQDLGERSAVAMERDLSALYAEVRPAVVSVVSFRVSRAPKGFGDPGPVSVSCRRLIASGIVMGDQRCVVTTARVAQPGDSVIIYFPGGRKVPATYLGMDPVLHIAVLRLEGDVSSPSLRLRAAPNDSLPEWVAAIAYGPWIGEGPEEPSLALSHRTAIEAVKTTYRGAPTSIWRIRAPFFPGNGGGALVSLCGEWLGLITGAVAGEKTHSACGTSVTGLCPIGVIVPADVVARAVGEIESGRRVSQGFLGIRTVRRPAGSGVSPETPGGVVVLEVLSGGPAACSGIRRGDLITRFDGVPVRSVIELTQLVRARNPGDRVEVDILRSGVAGRVEICVGDRHAAGLYLTRRKQERSEKATLELDLRRIEERRHILERRLKMLGRTYRDSAGRTDLPESSLPQ